MTNELIIDGVWLRSIMEWGDLEHTTCWPGGTESITFTAERSHRMFRPDAFVELVDNGGGLLGCGLMVEPSRGAPLLVEGLHRKGEDEPALDGGGDMTLVPNVSADQGIARGLPWLRAVDLGADPVELDGDQPHSVSQIMDARALVLGQQWGVLPDRRVWFEGTQPATLHLLPGVDGLAISRDGYASSLTARYLDSATSTYETVTRTDLVAQARWGRVPRLITTILAEGAPITEAAAEGLVDGLLAQGRSQMGWASPIEVQYGDVVNDYGDPVALETIYARKTIRLHGLDEDVADLSGLTYRDVPIARTRRKDGIVTIEPRGLSSPMNDALAALPA